MSFEIDIKYTCDHCKVEAVGTVYTLSSENTNSTFAVHHQSKHFCSLQHLKDSLDGKMFEMTNNSN